MDQFVLSVDRLKIDIYRSGREGRIFVVTVLANRAGECSERSVRLGFKFTWRRLALFTADGADLLVYTVGFIRAINMHPFPVVFKRTCILALFCFSTVGALIHGIALLRAGGVNSLNELVELMVRAVYGMRHVVAEVDAALVDKRNLRAVKMRIIPLTGVTLILYVGKLYT